MNAKHRKLRNLTVQINLFSVAYLRSRDETSINDAGFNPRASPDLPLQ